MAAATADVSLSTRITGGGLPWGSPLLFFKTGACMAKKNRPSVIKRQREAEKRQRQSEKIAKAALKRERRLESESEQSAVAPTEGLPEESEPLAPAAKPTQIS